MTGLDLPVKLRRGLGQGKIVPAEELAQRLERYDGDKDGALNREELCRFLVDNRVGGAWFCKMMSNNLFRTAEDRWSQEVDSIKIVALGRIIHYAMSRATRAVKRYILTPEAVLGLEPKRGLDGGDPTVTTEELMQASMRRRRPAAADVTAPAAQTPPPPQSRPPRDGPSPRGAPRARGRPPPRARASGRPRRPGGRAPGPRGPRRPSKPR